MKKRLEVRPGLNRHSACRLPLNLHGQIRANLWLHAAQLGDCGLIDTNSLGEGCLRRVGVGEEFSEVRHDVRNNAGWA